MSKTRRVDLCKDVADGVDTFRKRIAEMHERSGVPYRDSFRSACEWMLKVASHIVTPYPVLIVRAVALRYLGGMILRGVLNEANERIANGGEQYGPEDLQSVLEAFDDAISTACLFRNTVTDDEARAEVDLIKSELERSVVDPVEGDVGRVEAPNTVH